jgi:hypothetical protein
MQGISLWSQVQANSSKTQQLQRGLLGLMMGLLPMLCLAQSRFTALVEQTDATSVKVTVSVSGGQDNCGVEVDFGDQTLRKNRMEAGQPWVTEHKLASERDVLVKVQGAFVARGLRSVNACAGEAVTKAISPGAFKAVVPVVPMPAAPVVSAQASPAPQPLPVAPPAPVAAPVAPPPPAPPPPPAQQSLQQQAQGFSSMQSRRFPATLKNGCAIELPFFGPNVKLASLSKQDLTPNTCPASGRYTGFVSLGVAWTLAPNDRPEENYIGIRHGYVVNGHFVGVRIVQNQQGVLFIIWRDTQGNDFSKRYERNSSSYNPDLIRQTLNEGLDASVRPDERQLFSLLLPVLRQFDTDPYGEMRIYTSVEKHSQDFMNPNWVKPKDDPKVRGRSARGG